MDAGLFRWFYKQDARHEQDQVLNDVMTKLSKLAELNGTSLNEEMEIYLKSDYGARAEPSFTARLSEQISEMEN